MCTSVCPGNTFRTKCRYLARWFTLTQFEGQCHRTKFTSQVGKNLPEENTEGETKARSTSVYYSLHKSIIKTRSTGIVHTSAKARLTSVVIRILIRLRDSDRHQNLIIYSMALCQPSLKISCKSVRKFLSKLLTDTQTDKQRRLHILLGGDNQRRFAV